MSRLGDPHMRNYISEIRALMDGRVDALQWINDHPEMEDIWYGCQQARAIEMSRKLAGEIWG